MKTKPCPLALVLLLFSAGLFVAPASAPAQTIPALGSAVAEPEVPAGADGILFGIVEASEVEHREAADAEWGGAVEDAPLRVGHEVRTGEGKAKTRLRGRDSIRLPPDSHVAVAHLSGDGADVTLNLRNGSVWTQVAPRAGNREFKVVTPDLTAGVRGTVFKTGMVSGGGSRVAVVEGQVLVTSLATGETLLVPEGFSVTVGPDGGIGPLIPIPPEEVEEWEDWDGWAPSAYAPVLFAMPGGVPLGSDRLVLTGLFGDVAEAVPIEGAARCSVFGPDSPSIPVPGGFVLAVGSEISPNDADMEIPVTVQGAPAPIESFRFTVAYNPFKVKIDAAKPGDLTDGWTISLQREMEGRVTITGVPGRRGSAAVGDGVLVRLTVVCTDCPCETTVEATNLLQDLEGAKGGEAMLRFGTHDLPPPSPVPSRSGTRVDVGGVHARCKQGAKVPLTIEDADGVKAFTLTVLYDESCAKPKKVHPGLATAEWEFSWERVAPGVLVVSAFTLDDEQAINGSGELLILEFAPPSKGFLGLILPCFLTGALIAGLLVLAL